MKVKTLPQLKHDVAWACFVAAGLIPRDAGRYDYVLHHKDLALKKRDPERYAEWRVEDLVPMTRAEHNKVHRRTAGHKQSEQTKDLIRGKVKEYYSSDEVRRAHAEKIKAGLPEKAWNKSDAWERADEIARRYQEDVSVTCSMLGSLYGVSATIIHKILKKQGVALRPKGRHRKTTL